MVLARILPRLQSIDYLRPLSSNSHSSSRILREWTNSRPRSRRCEGSSHHLLSSAHVSGPRDRYDGLHTKAARIGGHVCSSWCSFLPPGLLDPSPHRFLLPHHLLLWSEDYHLRALLLPRLRLESDCASTITTSWSSGPSQAWHSSQSGTSSSAQRTL